MEAKITLVICLCLVGIVYSSNDTNREELLRKKWASFKEQFNKRYSSILEDNTRKQIFIDNLRKIEQHNDLFKKEAVTYQMGINQFGDLTEEEFANIVLVKNYTSYEPEPSESTSSPTPDLKAPASIDWRKNGAVTPVKNQKGCGACWAFSSTGALEGQHFRKTGRLVSLSEQQLLDCTPKHGDRNTCIAGSRYDALTYVKNNGGLESESTYPYQEKVMTCRYKPSQSVTSCKGYNLVQKTEAALELAVASLGPVSVSLDARYFQSYISGVFSSPKCSSTELNHGMLVVGYGVDSKLGKYWIIKNTWGPNWGENGYIRIAKDRNNLCGVATAALIPIV